MIEIIAFLYLLLLCVLLPFYMEDGYYQLATAKFHFFKETSLVAWICMVMVFLLKFLLQQGWNRKAFDRWIKRWNWCDCFVGLYLCSALLSFILSNYDAALWGAKGWYMGLFSQLCFGLIYLCARIVGRRQRLVKLLLFGMMFTAMMVGILGILDCFSINFLKLPGARQGFLSTLGNLNWYCGYFSILVPLIMGSWFGREPVYEEITRTRKAVYMELVGLSVATLISCLLLFSQGSAGGYGILIICVYFMTLCGLEDEKWFKRWITLLVFLLWSQFLIRVFGEFVSVGELYPSKVFYYLCENDMILWLAPFVTVLIFRGKRIFIKVLLERTYFKRIFSQIIMKKNTPKNIKKEKNIHLNRQTLQTIRAVVVVCTGAGALLFLLLFILNAIVPQGIWPVRNLSLFSFHKDWGNGRGGIWRYSVEAITHMSFMQLLFGVGPDCYGAYIYHIPTVSEAVQNQFGSNRLMCAHNEWLNLMINQGILGVFFYAGILVTSMVTLWKHRKERGICLGMLLAMVSYTIFNLTSFAQIISTPFIFLVFGLSQGLIKIGKNDKMINCLEDENALK